MKFDLHVHSAYSPDCATPLKKLAERYASLGFSGFALSDHGSMDGLSPLRAHVKEKKLPLEIIGACEFLSDRGEVIGLFIEEFIPKRDFGELCDGIHDQGGFVILPHPFDSVRKKICRPDLLPPDLLRHVDGLEVFNARSVFPADNAKSAAFAAEHKLMRTAGSDAHFLFEAGNGFVDVPDPETLAIALKKGRATIGGSSAPFFVHGPTTLVKWAKKFGIIKKPAKFA
ncbi:MAG: PHP domain-containing protein [Candidatus Micrarchaeota archaeon]